ncbi:hypothetical protein EV363DRAFT_1397991 [Boletus edulis]|uniref:Uncharacterized protein n=1 Tax=Boletus edulis BED1 TaxID=1328754 RepID=A0AAD4BTE4_BOLED|nr:hypothetical protein EV363DRAFT_1397991 [Boletus edulis]KAF8439391.1 hypothetical protein L210DRAFT_1018660 [Boletus edulis BED1]
MDAAVVQNRDVLGIVTGFLGARPSALEATLAYKTKLVKRELVPFFSTLMVLPTTVTTSPRHSTLSFLPG